VETLLRPLINNSNSKKAGHFIVVRPLFTCRLLFGDSDTNGALTIGQIFVASQIETGKQITDPRLSSCLTMVTVILLGFHIYEQA
jgi:hypothetical protein